MVELDYASVTSCPWVLSTPGGGCGGSDANSGGCGCGGCPRSGLLHSSWQGCQVLPYTCSPSVVRYIRVYLRWRAGQPRRGRHLGEASGGEKVQKCGRAGTRGGQREVRLGPVWQIRQGCLGLSIPRRHVGLRRGLRPLGGKARLKGLGDTRPPHPGAHTFLWPPRLECWGDQPENRVRVACARGSEHVATLDGHPLFLGCSPWPTTHVATLAGSTCRGRLANSQQEAGPRSYNAGTERRPQPEPGASVPWRSSRPDHGRVTPVQSSAPQKP